MSDQPVEPVAGSTFWDWLKSDPLNLAEFLKVCQNFIDAHGGPTAIPPSTGGPPAPRQPGDEVVLTTMPVTQEQLNAISNGVAEEIVKDKALEWAKGLVTGLTMGG